MKPPILSLDTFIGLTREATIAKLKAEAETLSLAERFMLLHQLGIYQGKESYSGPGSSLTETAALRKALPVLIQKYAVRSLLDVPCGDFHWMQHLNLHSIEYIGADIVPQIITQNTECFRAPQRTFVVLDLTQDSLPTVDLVLCRDLLVHLSLDDIQLAMRNLVRSGCRLLLVSHFTACRENIDIQSGDFRPINLCQTPFHFPPPMTIITEQSKLAKGAFHDRSMALWSLDSLTRLPFFQTSHS